MTMTTAQARRSVVSRLAAVHGEREARAMCEMIFETVLGWRPVDILMRDDSELPTFAPGRFEEIVTRVERGEPLQYVLGVARFHGHEFKVTPATLIPRPETEQLVDMVVDACGDRDDLRVLDIGTGTGCIALSLARALRFPRVTALDVSRAALAVASENASRLRVKVDFVQCDILRETPRGEWDVIVSNPPYVRESERATMERHVTDYEPAGALFVPDADPLLFYRAIAGYAARSLSPGGRLFLEINSALSKETTAAVAAAGISRVETVRDFNGLPRFVAGSR